MTFFPYDSVSEFFASEGDFAENVDFEEHEAVRRDWEREQREEWLASQPVVEEHAFVPGDGEMTRTDTCQFAGCGGLLSEHEEGEPCCYPSFATQGRDHAFDCQPTYVVSGS